MKAVHSALAARGISAPVMMVRSDGSLMVDSLAHTRPVETILSGPAASVLGGRALTDCEECLIVDMGGTTTDISLMKGGLPAMSNGGIRIGGCVRR
jgi:N-methylhydantoinase A/oxoprolinase/acetone carboxylase beta subunit